MVAEPEKSSIRVHKKTSFRGELNVHKCTQEILYTAPPLGRTGRIFSTRLGRLGRCHIFGRLSPSSRITRQTVLRLAQMDHRLQSNGRIRRCPKVR